MTDATVMAVARVLYQNLFDIDNTSRMDWVSIAKDAITAYLKVLE